MKYFFLIFILLILNVSSTVLGEPPFVSCASVPRFATKMGVKKPLISTADRKRTGLVMYPVLSPNRLGNPIRLPSWKNAGRLGPFFSDEKGNIFVAPVPNINALENPPESQNWIYKIDSDSGELNVFIKIPVDIIPSQTNPYGLLGLEYDCKRKIIYASTISGSSPETERGKIVAIEASSGKIISEFKNIDVMGIGLGDDSLFVGKTRSSEIFKINLDKDGHFASNKAEYVIRLEPFNISKARKIRILNDIMTVHTTEFYYNLAGQTEFEQPVFRYKLQNNSWQRIN